MVRVHGAGMRAWRGASRAASRPLTLCFVEDVDDELFSNLLRSSVLGIEASGASAASPDALDHVPKRVCLFLTLQDLDELLNRVHAR